MAERLSIISIISFAVSGICFVLAIFFWSKFGILGVIGDLTGRTAKKSIERMRTYNEKSGGKAYKSSTVNVGRGKLTDTMPHSVKLKKKNTEQPETGLLSTNRTELSDSQATELLDSSNSTALLDDSETELLGNPVAAPLPEKRHKGVKLKMIDEIILTHTDEVI